MIVTVFRARPSADADMQRQYMEWYERLGPIVSGLDGLLSIKQFVAEDGEVCFIVEFRDEITHQAWAEHPVHLAAKEFGKTFFSSYDIKVCELRHQKAKA